MTVEFTAATQLTELTNKDSLKGLFGKLALAVKTVIDLARNAITTSNIGNQSVKHADSAGAVAWGMYQEAISIYTNFTYTWMGCHYRKTVSVYTNGTYT